MIDEPVEAFAAADLLVMPSRSEGMPAALIEAGLAGLPAVATDVGGVSDVVLAGQAGELVAPGDPVQLARAIRLALANQLTYGFAAREPALPTSRSVSSPPPGSACSTRLSLRALG